ncbi:MAG: amidohydrolase family protein [Chloroflexi bacterium]|nr:amidohydrolase family protein [Chloroflexota bacterium]
MIEAQTVFSADLLIDGSGRAPVRDPYLVVAEGRILEVGAGRPPDALRERAKFFAMPGATIIPGLVDAHVHLALAMHLPDWAAIDADPARLAFLAARHAQEALRAGITTVADCGARHGVTIALREAIAQGWVEGPRVWACGEWLTVTNGHGYFWTRRGFDSAEELRKGVREMVWQGADFIKIMASGGTTQGAKTNRRRAQYSAEELRVAVEDAHRLNKRVICHVNATEAMRHCLKAGVDVVEHCNWLGAQEGTIEYDHDLAREGGRRGLCAGINIEQVFKPLSQNDGYAQDWGDLTRWDLMRRMQDVGVNIFVDTDAAGKDYDALPRMMARMVEEGKAEAAETLAMATLVPARALGLSDEIGSLEKGKQADMVFLPANPLIDITALTRPLAVVKGGCIMVGKHAFPDANRP